TLFRSVVGELEVLQPVWLQAKGAPDSAHRGVAQPALFGHGASAPVSGVSRQLLQGLGQHRLHLLVADLAGGSTAGLVEKSRRTALDVARAPLPDGLVCDVEFAGGPAA